MGRRWKERLGVDILDGIGSTEMLHIFLSNRAGDVQYGTSGTPVPGYRVRLVDEGGDEIIAAEEPGELQISGPSSAVQYWNQPEKSRATFLEGWTRSGDKYYRNRDGYYVYSGRSDDMLKVSGIYVSPIEVESALIAHEAVLEAAVVGIEDEERLIKPKAFVVLKPGYGPGRGDAPGAAGARQGHARTVQISALDRVRRGPAQDRNRQDPALQAARRLALWRRRSGVARVHTIKREETDMVGKDRKLRVTVSALGLGLGVLLAQGAAEAADTVKVGLMLPYTGTYASLGNAITNGFKQYVAEQGGKLGGREVEYFVVDDESDPAKATENANKLVKRDNVDVLVGTVHSGVALAMAKVARDSKTLMIIPNAGADELTGPLCAPNVFRASFSAWQPAYAMGKVVAERGHKNVVAVSWKYSFGEQSVAGFKEAFEQAGGKVVKELFLPFPNVEFQPFLTEIANLKPDAVFVFFAGAGAAKFVKDYEAAGLKTNFPLYGSGFLTDGTLEAMGGAGEGVLTTLHYADGLDNAREKSFRSGYVAAYKAQPDVYAVQGYDSAQLLAAGLSGAPAGAFDKEAVMKAMSAAGHRQPARRLHAVQGQQPRAGHLPAQGRGRPEQGGRSCGTEARRSGARLQADEVIPSRGGGRGPAALAPRPDFIRLSIAPRRVAHVWEGRVPPWISPRS